MKGQALVEFALITPILLVLMLGGLSVGLLVLDRIVLTHAAQEAAVWGASHAGDCSGALARVPQVLGRQPDSKVCDRFGQVIEVTLSDDRPVLAPLVPLPTSVTVTARAMVREETPSASPTSTPSPSPAP